jgi:hypothetical protein
MKSSTAARKKLLSRQLLPEEVSLILAISEAEALVAGRLGLAEGLVTRGWLVREGRLVRLSDTTRLLLDEAAEATTRHA